RITGYSKDELLKMSISDLILEKSYKESLTHFKDLTKTGIAKTDMAFKDKSGNIRWWAIQAVKLSEKRFLGFAKDITERKEIEESLRLSRIELEMQNEELAVANLKGQQNQEKYSKLYDYAPSGYLSLSKDGDITELNFVTAEMLCKERPRLINNRFALFISEVTRPEFNLFLDKVFTSKIKQTCEVIIITKGNLPIYVNINGIIIQNNEFCLLTLVDITERKLAELALKISERKYRSMLNSSPDGILLINMKGIITEVSDIGLELIGTNSSLDLLGKHFFRFIPHKSKPILKEITDKTVNEGISQNIEMEINRKDGSLFLSEISSTLIQDSTSSPVSFMLTIRDISFRKQREKKLIHADRMASLGEMASGMAHEINQPLNTMSLIMDNMLFEAARNNDVRKDYLKKKSDKIFENITRIRNIIDHVRTFSQNHNDSILTSFDINLSINNATSMISEQFKHFAIKLDLQLEDNLPLIIGNTLQFEQVVVNMLLNAKDAVLEKKDSQSVPFDMLVGIKSFLDMHNLVIEISDNGTGISDEDIEHIMLPFYTTKDTGKGTGLGLSISYQILKEMNGTIEIRTEPPNGTTFKIIIIRTTPEELPRSSKYSSLNLGRAVPGNQDSEVK
ncbi:MAG: PAS domain S-box protein, partial [Bacteroidetes bacterium]|nr:PAS domain S-box protein [Bacteroidota bacterium]